MFGQNVLRKQDLSDPYHLRVQDLFLTIQGEGPYAGVPALFLRLAGCNLACTFCDTDFESNYDNRMSLPEIGNRIMELLAGTKVWLLVLTGGEPLLQPLEALFHGIFDNTQIRHIQIESAGTVWQDKLDQFLASGRLSLVCSPKTPKIANAVAVRCSDFKYIVRDGYTSEVDGLPTFNTQKDGEVSAIYRPANKRATIWVQACDEGLGSENQVKTQANHAATVRIAIQHGYRISYQLHKALGLA